MKVGDRITSKSSKAVRVWEVEKVFTLGALMAKEVKKDGTYGRRRIIHRPEQYKLVELETAPVVDNVVVEEIETNEHP